MRISSRALHALLAGEITLEYFAESNGLAPLTSNANPFRQFLSDGGLIRSVNVEASETEDDDWIVFEFGPADPAISPFRSATSK